MYPPCRAAGKRRLSSVYHYIKGYREKQFLSFPSAEGKCRRPAAGGKRGRDTKVSLPLLTPHPVLRTRRPSVARLNARGPQGRLVLQGYTLDRSGAFRSGTPPPCTGWPRTVMRGAKEGLGESRGGKGTIWCPCPLLSPPPDGGILAGEHRHSRPPKAANVHAHFERKSRLQRRTAVSAEPLALC